MIYEFRTYDLHPRTVPDFEKGVAEKLKEGRLDARRCSAGGRPKRDR